MLNRAAEHTPIYFTDVFINSSMLSTTGIRSVKDVQIWPDTNIIYAYVQKLYIDV